MSSKSNQLLSSSQYNVKFTHCIKQKTVLPTPGICATMKSILPLPPPFYESEGKWGGGGHVGESEGKWGGHDYKHKL